MRIPLLFFFALLVLLYANVYAGNAKTASINILIKYDNQSNKDRTVLRLFSCDLGAYGNEKFTIRDVENEDESVHIFDDFISPVRNNVSKFSIKSRKSLTTAQLLIRQEDGTETQLLTFNFVVKPGDNVHITQKEGRFIFSGPGSQSLCVATQLQHLEKKEIVHSLTGIDPNRLIESFSKVDSLAKEKFSLLNSFKNLSKDRYDYLKTDIIISCEKLKMDFLSASTNEFTDLNKFKTYSSLLNEYNDPIWNEQTIKELRQNRTTIHDLAYLDFLVSNQLIFNTCFRYCEKPSLEKCYHYLVANYSGATREWLIYRLVHNYLMDSVHSFGESIPYCIDNSIGKGYVQSTSIKKYFKYVLTTNIPGKLAYNFCLPDTNGKIIQLSDFRGKVVLLDFYFQFCGSCALVHPYLDTINRKMKNKNFVLIAIIFDNIKPLTRREWMKVIQGNVYASIDNVNLIARKINGDDSKLRLKFGGNIGGGSLIYIDKHGKYLPTPMLPTFDGGKSALKLIEENL